MMMVKVMMIKLEWAVPTSLRLGEGEGCVCVGDCDFAGRQAKKAGRQSEIGGLRRAREKCFVGM